MGIVIGIDVGGSTTKIVGINGEQIQSPMFITATDPVTSLFGAFGKYIYDNGIQLVDVEQVMLTGVGSAFVNSLYMDCLLAKRMSLLPMVWEPDMQRI